MSKKKIIILCVILAVFAGIFCYFWFTWLIPEWNDYNLNPNAHEPTYPAPVLFGKEDYKIDQRQDGTYIVIEKVGLTCRVPEGWTVTLAGDDEPISERWIEMSSPDEELKSSLRVKGCGLSITAEISKQDNEEIKKQIAMINAGASTTDNILGKTYEIIKIGEKKWLKGTLSQYKIMGEFVGVSIPIGKEKLLDISTAFAPGWKEFCEPIWNNFLRTIELK